MTGSQRKALESFYSREFSTEQIDELREGIEAGVDVSVYALETISAQDMAHIRRALTYKEYEKNQSKNFDDQTKHGVFSEEDKKKIERVKYNEELKKEIEVYKEAIEYTTFENLFVFSLIVSGAAIIAAIYTMLITLSSTGIAIL